MTDPAPSPSCCALPDWLLQNQERIITLWKARICAEMPSARGYSTPALLDHLPEFLERLCAVLTLPAPMRPVTEVKQVAELHAIQRARTGVQKSPVELLLEYDVLRRTIFEVADENGPVSPRERELILNTLAQATRTSEERFLKEKTASEKRLAEFEARFRILSETLPEIIWITDPDGSLEYCNHRWSEYTGLSADQAGGFRWETVLAASDRSQILEAFRRGQEERAEFSVEIRLRDSNGRFAWHLSRASPVIGSDGNVERWVGVTTNIDAQKRRQERERFLSEANTLLSSSLDYLKTLDRVAELAITSLADWCIIDLMEHGKLRRVSVAHTDPARAELVGRFAELAPDPESPGGAGLAIREMRPVIYPGPRRPRIGSGTDLAEHLVGTQNPEQLRMIDEFGIVSYISVPMRARQQTLGAITFVSAREDREYRAEDLRFAEDLCAHAALAIDNARLYREARQAIRAREEVLEVVSHDLKNPLSAVLLNANFLLRMRLPGEEGLRVHEQAERINRASLRMQFLIQDVLDLAKLDAGTLRLEIHPESAEILIQEAIEMMRPQASERNISVSFLSSRAERDVCCQVLCDHGHTLRVLTNLLSNAIKFSREGSQVEVSIRRAGDQVEFRVSDRGNGIRAEDQPRLFERFWQAKETSRKGTGLGLSIVRALVEAQSGRVWATSELGRGSEFYFTLPLAPKGAS